MLVRSKLVVAGLALSVSTACGSTNKREIKRAEIDTEDARLTGFLEGLQDDSCAPFCTPLERNLESSVDDEVVLDEAILRKTNSESCFDVVVRTTLGYDTPITALSPGCMLDGATAVGTVKTETFTVMEYGGGELDPTATEGAADSAFRVVAADMTEADLHAKAGEATTTRVYYSADDYALNELRVVERKATVCCPGSGSSTIQLSLTNGVDPTTEDVSSTEPPAGIDFVWFIVE